MQTKDDVIQAFMPVQKLDEGQKMRLLHLENTFKEAATDIIEYVPECPDRTVALRGLLSAKFLAVQALTHYVPPKKVAAQTDSDKKATGEKGN